MHPPSLQERAETAPAGGETGLGHKTPKNLQQWGLKGFILSPARGQERWDPTWMDGAPLCPGLEPTWMEVILGHLHSLCWARDGARCDPKTSLGACPRAGGV